jgi:hypothetical protein
MQPLLEEREQISKKLRDSKISYENGIEKLLDRLDDIMPTFEEFEKECTQYNQGKYFFITMLLFMVL